MASNILQIKRSQTTGTPASLANGELAFTSAGNVVFIGNYGSVLAIGGERNPGVLTANQALVANSTSFLNIIKTNNLTVTGSINANGSTGSAGDLLTSDGAGKTYWTPASSLTVGPEYIKDTDSRTLYGNLVFTGANTRVDNLNVGTINRSPKLTLTGDVSGNVTFTNLGDAILNVTVNNANGVTLGVDTTGDYVQQVSAGNGVNVSVSSGAGSIPVVTVKPGTGVTVDSSGVSIGQNVASTASVTFGGLQINGNANFGTSFADHVTFGGTINSDIVPTNVNGSRIGLAGAIWNEGYFEKIILGTSYDTTVTGSGGTVQLNNLSANGNITANTATIYHDVYIGGTLHITGNAVFSNVETYVVTDPLIQLAANNNLTDILDIGIFGNYGTDGNPSNHKHTGIFRDASDGVYKIFTNLDVAPSTYVDTGDSSYRQGTLQAYLNSGALTSSASNLSIIATNTLSVNIQANTLTLTTPLAYDSGGTGFKTYTNGDLLVGNTVSGLNKLTIGPAGYILQSDGTNLVYASLDGGSF